LGAYEREVRFSCEVAPSVDGPVANCRLALLDAEEGWFTLLVEDAAPAEHSSSALVEHWLVTVGTVAVAGPFVARLAGVLDQREAQMSVLPAATRELSASSSAADARPVICDALLHFGGSRSTGIFAPDAEGSALVFTALAGAPVRSTVGVA
jgi:hypothetical protein